MKKIKIKFKALVAVVIFTISSLSFVFFALANVNTFFNFSESKIDQILDISKAKSGSIYKKQWKDMADKSGSEVSKCLNNLAYYLPIDISKPANHFKDYKPFKTVKHSDPYFTKHILLDMEMDESKTSQHLNNYGINLSCSILHEREFFQVYNYQDLINDGWKVSVTSDSSSVVVETPNSNGDIYYCNNNGIIPDTYANISITATKGDDKLDMVNLKIDVVKPSDNSYLIWRAYQYVKYEFHDSSIYQEMAAHTAVQLYSEIMYKSSLYNGEKKQRIYIISENDYQTLKFMAYNSGLIGYTEFWPSGNSPLKGYFFPISCDYYDNPYLEDNKDWSGIQTHTPLIQISSKIRDFALNTIKVLDDVSIKETK
ncbi:hypothetical protein [Spiroplasma endosymbiont of Aspidapion aeneum]|uniref:hypothetical protein n=1 Tax=Spiroplasma endosymbiont of Aspidapion aeneum TaxID=3066276 RepID=UPI00313CB80A